MRTLLLLVAGAIALVGSVFLPAAAHAAPGDPAIAIVVLGTGGEVGSSAFVQVRVTNTAGNPAHADVSTDVTLPEGLRVALATPGAQCDRAAPAGQLQVRSTTASGVTLQGSIGAGVTNCEFSILVVGALPGVYELCGPAVLADPIGLEPTAACGTLTFVDTTPPAAPVIESPIDGAVAGASFIVEGTSEPGSTVRITDGETVLCATTATQAGRFSCTVTERPDGPLVLTPTAADASGNSTTGASVAVTIDTRTAPVFVRTQLPSATAGTPYDVTIVASGKPAPVYSVISGRLPDGVALDPATGRLSGTPTESGAFEVTFAATNSVGADELSVSFTVDAAAVAPIVPDQPNLPGQPNSPHLPNSPKSGAAALAVTGAAPAPIVFLGVAFLLGGLVIASTRIRSRPAHSTR